MGNDTRCRPHCNRANRGLPFGSAKRHGSTEGAAEDGRMMRAGVAQSKNQPQGGMSKW